VIVQEVDLDRAVSSELIPEGRRVLEPGVDEIEIRVGASDDRELRAGVRERR
jgi:hypothetical protein